MAWGDYDGDGDPDLYVTHDGPNLLVRNDGSDRFTDVTATPLDDGNNAASAPWGDYDNDGDLDLFLVNYLAASKLFRNDGGGAFVDATPPVLGASGPGLGAAWADYDRDGDLDLYVVNYGRPNCLLRNDGGGAFVDATTGPLADAGWELAAAWGDYDDDGDPDLYITNDGPNRLLRNDGGGAFTRVTGLAIEDGGAGQGAAWGDYDNDGDLDLYVTGYGTPNMLLRNDGGDVFTDVTSGPLGDAGNGTGVAWADYDGDGDLDLYFANDGGSNELLRNELAGGAHWLHLDLVGTVSNRSAIGARVRLVAAGVSRIQEVSGGSGYFSQNSLTVEFGLGAAPVADSLVVRWPSGIVQALAGVEADRRLTIVEPAATAVGGERDPELGLDPPAPNPFRRGTTLRFSLPVRAHARLSVHDLQGRRVATLVDGVREAGRHSVRWDGRGDGARSARAGVYWARLDTPGGSRIRKLLVIP